MSPYVMKVNTESGPTSGGALKRRTGSWWPMRYSYHCPASCATSQHCTSLACGINLELENIPSLWLQSCTSGFELRWQTDPIGYRV